MRSPLSHSLELCQISHSCYILMRDPIQGTHYNDPSTHWVLSKEQIVCAQVEMATKIVKNNETY